MGQCPVCARVTAGLFTDRRYMLCRVRLGLHQHTKRPGWCIGSNALVRPMTGIAHRVPRTENAPMIPRQLVLWEAAA